MRGRTAPRCRGWGVQLAAPPPCPLFLWLSLMGHPWLWIQGSDPPWSRLRPGLYLVQTHFLLFELPSAAVSQWESRAWVRQVLGLHFCFNKTLNSSCSASRGCSRGSSLLPGCSYAGARLRSVKFSTRRKSCRPLLLFPVNIPELLQELLGASAQP